MNTNHIEAFCKETGLRFIDNGEIYIGRKCVGIMNPKTDCFLAYTQFNEDYGKVMEHEVAAKSIPSYGHHRGPYLAVLFDGTEVGRIHAVDQLNKWIEKIMAASYELKEYTEMNSMSADPMGGPIKQLCLTGGVTFGRFLEIF